MVIIEVAQVSCQDPRRPRSRKHGNGRSHREGAGTETGPTGHARLMCPMSTIDSAACSTGDTRPMSTRFAPLAIGCPAPRAMRWRSSSLAPRCRKRAIIQCANGIRSWRRRCHGMLSTPPARSPLTGRTVRRYGGVGRARHRPHHTSSGAQFCLTRGRPPCSGWGPSQCPWQLSRYVVLGKWRRASRD
jgi:hypothetical protein